MNFKLWFILSETLDDMTKGALEKYKAPPDELAAFIKELEDEPDPVDRKAAFVRLAQRFPPTKQKPVKQEDGRIKLYKDKLDANQITKPEFDTFVLFIGESDKDRVTEMTNLLRRFIENDILTLEVKNNKIYITKDNETKEFNDFTRFESELHSIEGSLTQYKQKSGVFNPIIGEKKYRNNLAAKGDNVWVFRGDTPDLCRIFGKSQKWCISSSKSAAYWFDYRINVHQTQYFVFDFNKEENDPARYVNPGVAPKFMYSEWVDAKNEHKADPENRNSAVGINGYTSINQYKKYLVSKGIPENIWTTTEPEVWEKRLQSYDNRKNFEGAKNDSDPRVFPMYLKIVDYIEDDDFNKLTDEQKKEFVFGKIDILTDKQFEFAGNASGYYNSLDSANKIKFALRARNQKLILELIKKTELDAENVFIFINYAHTNDKHKIAKLLGPDNINKLNNDNVYDLLNNASDKTEMAKILSQEKIDNLPSDNIIYLLSNAFDKTEMAEILGENNIDKLTNDDVCNLLKSASDRTEMAKILGQEKIDNLPSDKIVYLLNYPGKIDEMVRILGQEKIDNLPSGNIEYLLGSVDYNPLVFEKRAIALGADNINKLTGDQVFSLLRNTWEKYEIARTLGENNIDKLTGNQVKMIIVKLMNRMDRNNMDEMIKILGEKNINKLNAEDIEDLKRKGINNYPTLSLYQIFNQD